MFGPSTWLLVAGLILLNVGCFFAPTMLNDLAVMIAPKTWAWWYYPVFIVLVAFTVRWFLIYRSFETSLAEDEVKWFCVFSGAVALLLLGIVTVHRTVDTRPLFYPIYRWFAYGEFSIGAFFVVFSSLATVAGVIYLAWRWVSELLAD